MIQVRPAAKQDEAGRARKATWKTAFPDAHGAIFGCASNPLRTIDAAQLDADGGALRLLLLRAEVITYVREGALVYQTLSGASGLIQAGEVRHTAGRNEIYRTQAVTRRTRGTKIFQIWLGAVDARMEPRQQQKRFGTAERRGSLCAVASQDGRAGSLTLCHPALVFSSLLMRGQHVIYELPEGRKAWLHLVKGEVSLGEFALTAGDSAAISLCRGVSFTAQEDTEILLVDVAQGPDGTPATSE